MSKTYGGYESSHLVENYCIFETAAHPTHPVPLPLFRINTQLGEFTVFYENSTIDFALSRGIPTNLENAQS